MREKVARPFECNFWTWNKLSFSVADMLKAAYHDILARMHHNHSTTLTPFTPPPNKEKQNRFLKTKRKLQVHSNGIIFEHHFTARNSHLLLNVPGGTRKTPKTHSPVRTSIARWRNGFRVWVTIPAWQTDKKRWEMAIGVVDFPSKNGDFP